MTLLHAQIDLLEGELVGDLAGRALGLSSRAFAILRLTDDDGVYGLGEASPLPGTSPDTIEQAVAELGELCGAPLEVDPGLPARTLLDRSAEVQFMQAPSARFALETAMLDWLGKVHEQPVYRLLAPPTSESIPIADLVFERDPSAWPAHVADLCRDACGLTGPFQSGRTTGAASSACSSRLRSGLQKPAAEISNSSPTLVSTPAV